MVTVLMIPYNNEVLVIRSVEDNKIIFYTMDDSGKRTSPNKEEEIDFVKNKNGDIVAFLVPSVGAISSEWLNKL